MIMLKIHIGPKTDKALDALTKVLRAVEVDQGFQDNSDSELDELEGTISEAESKSLSDAIRELIPSPPQDALTFLPYLDEQLEGMDITEMVKPKDLVGEGRKVEAGLIDTFRAYATSPSSPVSEIDSEYGYLKKEEITAHMLLDILKRIQLRIDSNGNVHAYNPLTGAFDVLSKYALQRMIRRVLGPSAEPFMLKSRLADLEALIKSHPNLYHADEDFKPPVHMVNLRNGVLNLDTGELLPHSSAYRFTSVLNGRYLKKFRVGRKFLSLVRFICENDPEKLQLLQQYLGYVLSNGNQCKKLLIIIGPPNCGKSVLLEIIRAILGHEQVASVQLHLLEKRFVSGHVADKAANIVTEMSAAPITDITTLKLLTSEDSVSGEKKGKDRFSYISRLKFLIASNHVPRISGGGIEDAFYDRVILFPTKATVDPTNRDPDLKEHILREERDFVVTWCLQGLMALRKKKYVFDIPEDSMELQQKLKSAVSSEKEFVKSCCRFSEDKDDRVHSYMLMDLYDLYCKSNCLDHQSREALFDAIAQIGGIRSKFRMPGEPKRVNPRNGFRHLVIVPEEEIDMASTESKAILRQSGDESDGFQAPTN